MIKSIFQTFRHAAITAALGLKKRPNQAAGDHRPEPVRFDLDDAPSEEWLFAPHERAVEHRRQMLAGEMAKLSELLGAVRAVASDLALEAPVRTTEDATAFGAPFAVDALLFEGDAGVWRDQGVFVAEDAFLFEEDDRRAAPAPLDATKRFSTVAAAA